MTTAVVVALDPVTTVEITVLTAGAGVLVWAGLTRQRWDTISELFWLIRDTLGQRGRIALAAGLAGALGFLWWHLVFG